MATLTFDRCCFFCLLHPDLIYIYIAHNSVRRIVRLRYLHEKRFHKRLLHLVLLRTTVNKRNYCKHGNAFASLYPARNQRRLCLENSFPLAHLFYFPPSCQYSPCCLTVYIANLIRSARRYCTFALTFATSSHQTSGSPPLRAGEFSVHPLQWVFSSRNNQRIRVFPPLFDNESTRVPNTLLR